MRDKNIAVNKHEFPSPSWLSFSLTHALCRKVTSMQSNNTNLIQMWTDRAEDLDGRRLDVKRFALYIEAHEFSDFDAALAAFDAQVATSAAEDAKTMKPSAEHMVIHSSPTRPMKAR